MQKASEGQTDRKGSHDSRLILRSFFPRRRTRARPRGGHGCPAQCCNATAISGGFALGVCGTSCRIRDCSQASPPLPPPWARTSSHASEASGRLWNLVWRFAIGPIAAPSRRKPSSLAQEWHTPPTRRPQEQLMATATPEEKKSRKTCGSKSLTPPPVAASALPPL